jgi:hypothetical protein
VNPRRKPDLNALIEDITVDCYGDGEVLTALETAFDNDATLPCPGTVVGEDVKVSSSRPGMDEMRSSPGANAWAAGTTSPSSMWTSTATTPPPTSPTPTAAGTAEPPYVGTQP